MLPSVSFHIPRLPARLRHGSRPHKARGANPGPEAVRILAECSPSSLGVRDDRGNMPLHALYRGARGVNHEPIPVLAASTVSSSSVSRPRGEQRGSFALPPRSIGP